MLQALVVVEKPLGMLRTSAKQHKIRHDVYRFRCVRTMPRDHEPTFLELGPRKAPPVPVYGSPKQVITIRKLPVRRDGDPKISFSLNFTAADGRKPVTFEIAEATLNHVFGLGGNSPAHVFERNRRKIHEVAATVYFRGRRTTIAADDFNTA
jgi:Protein of unknown function (DUF1488)